MQLCSSVKSNKLHYSFLRNKNFYSNKNKVYLDLMLYVILKLDKRIDKKDKNFIYKKILENMDYLLKLKYEYIKQPFYNLKFNAHAKAK